ncbi:restriction endonuclease subunit S [Aeromonas caviae]|uniref:restriction endonuclease subunit S n=2 Tax=Aeromonas caviae TaxID=648 RepID=UPI001FC88E77|nr:restriction endonuclease subunit S [Aeromonas caviae]GKR54684.1 type I restriction-modification enzyme, S subunit [Aeromonas caviae]GKR93080.1 type I restriction-modification enzyme, S subunit [Aeromonas caviae]
MAEQMKQNKAGEMAAKQIIPAGYKLSEAGIIPEDWEALPLGGICKVQGGFAFKSERFKKTGVPILRISNIQSGYLDVNEVVYYSVGEKIPKQFEVNDGDALIAMSGATTGKVGIYNENGVAYLNQRVGKFVLHGNADIRYIQHVVGSDLYKIALNNMLEQGAQPNISSSQLERIVIRKPTIEIEQKIIADVLSDTDKLIACLAQLIAKKQAIKTATMQQLLTGRTRLPQFALRPDGTPKGYKSSELGQIPEDWGINSINKVGSIITGSTPPTAVGCYWDGDIPWITPTDIGDAKNIFESERRITEKGLQEIRGLPANSVLVTCIASIGKNAILKNAGACNQQINAIVPTALFDVDFLYYNIEFSKERLRQCAGITATPIISKALFMYRTLSGKRINNTV